jgi:hypothetical protein
VRSGIVDEKRESGDIGPHCGMKRLIAYRQGTLPAAERERVQEHLSLCPRCTGLLRELRDFEAAADSGETGPESLRHEAWDSLARRLPAPATAPLAGAGRSENHSWRRLPRFAISAAAALLLVVAGFALWVTITALQERQRLTQLERQVQERDAALAVLQSSLAATRRQLDAARGQSRDSGQVAELEARVAELTSELAELRRARHEPERQEQIAVASQEIRVSVAPRFVLRGQEAPEGGFLRGGGTVNPVRTPSPKGHFRVALNLAGHPAHGEYRLELLDRNGKLLWADRRSGASLLGDAGTAVSFEGLGPGLDRLRIEGLRPDGSELLAEYLLQVEPSQ